MKREIKFRVWNKQKKEIEILRMLEDFSCMYVQENLDTLMQFTGLKDKNGKEIYEGDIVSRENVIAGAHDILEVGFFEACFYVLKRGGIGNGFGESEPCYLGLSKPHLISVIGNIYENPNLLTP